MSWMILPCLFVYLFVGVVLTAVINKHQGCDENGLSATAAVAWPVPLVILIIIQFGKCLTYLIKKVRTFL